MTLGGCDQESIKMIRLIIHCKGKGEVLRGKGQRVGNWSLPLQQARRSCVACYLEVDHALIRH